MREALKMRLSFRLPSQRFKWGCLWPTVIRSFQFSRLNQYVKPSMRSPGPEQCTLSFLVYVYVDDVNNLHQIQVPLEDVVAMRFILRQPSPEWRAFRWIKSFCNTISLANGSLHYAKVVDIRVLKQSQSSQLWTIISLPSSHPTYEKFCMKLSCFPIIWKRTKREQKLYQAGRKWGEKGEKGEGGVCEGQDRSPKICLGKCNNICLLHFFANTPW